MRTQRDVGRVTDDLHRAFAGDVDHVELVELLRRQDQRLASRHHDGGPARQVEHDFGQVDFAFDDQRHADQRQDRAGLEDHVFGDRQRTSGVRTGVVEDPFAVGRQRRSAPVRRRQRHGGDAVTRSEGEGRHEAVVGRCRRGAVVVGAVDLGDDAEVQRAVEVVRVDDAQGVANDAGIRRRAQRDGSARDVVDCAAQRRGSATSHDRGQAEGVARFTAGGDGVAGHAGRDADHGFQRRLDSRRHGRGVGHVDARHVDHFGTGHAIQHVVDGDAFVVLVQGIRGDDDGGRVTDIAVGDGPGLGVVQVEGRARARSRQDSGETGGIEGQCGDVDVGCVDRGDVDVVVTGHVQQRRCRGVGHRRDVAVGDGAHVQRSAVAHRPVTDHRDAEGVHPHVEQVQTVDRADTDVADGVQVGRQDRFAGLVDAVVVVDEELRRQDVGVPQGAMRVDGQGVEVDRREIRIRCCHHVVDEHVAGNDLATQFEGQVFDVLFRRGTHVAEGQVADGGEVHQFQRAVHRVGGQQDVQQVDSREVDTQDGARQRVEQALDQAAFVVHQGAGEPQPAQRRVVAAGVHGTCDVGEQPYHVGGAVANGAGVEHIDIASGLSNGLEADGLAAQAGAVAEQVVQHDREGAQVGGHGQRHVVVFQRHGASDVGSDAAEVDRGVAQANDVDLGSDAGTAGVRARDDVQVVRLISVQGQGLAVGQHDVQRLQDRQVDFRQVHALVDVQGGVGTQVDVEDGAVDDRQTGAQAQLAAGSGVAEVQRPAGAVVSGCRRARGAVQRVAHQRHLGDARACREGEVGGVDVDDLAQIEVAGQAGGVDEGQVAGVDTGFRRHGRARVRTEHDVTTAGEEQGLGVDAAHEAGAGAGHGQRTGAVGGNGQRPDVVVRGDQLLDRDVAGTGGRQGRHGVVERHVDRGEHHVAADLDVLRGVDDQLQQVVHRGVGRSQHGDGVDAAVDQVGLVTDRVDRQGVEEALNAADLVGTGGDAQVAIQRDVAFERQVQRADFVAHVPVAEDQAGRRGDAFLDDDPAEGRVEEAQVLGGLEQAQFNRAAQIIDRVLDVRRATDDERCSQRLQHRDVVPGGIDLGREGREAGKQVHQGGVRAARDVQTAGL